VVVPHLVWEGVLLLVTVAVAGAAAALSPVFTGDGLWWTMAYVGLVASGLALSLRTATPNLAVGGIAGAAGAGYAWLVAEGELAPLLAAVVVLIAAVVLGAVLGAVAGVTSAPAWAVSLAGLAATYAFAVAVLGPGGTPVAEQLPGPLDAAGTWFAVFLLLSLGGGGVLAVPSVRRLLGANRTTGGDAVRFTGRRLVGALVGFVGSSVLASLAGLALVVQLRVAFGGAGDLFLLFLGLGAALIGGVSVFGGRGGIAGTVLGVALLAVIVRWLDIELGADHPWSRWVVVVVAILLGIGLSRLIEAVAPLTPATPVGPPPPPPAVAPPPHPPGPVAAQPAAPSGPSDAGPAS
jgi:ribose/xylose/arabinose/galactoside ABC-type transport system permease subunit